MSTSQVPPSGAGSFAALWIGQLISTLGSVMTSFAFGITIFRSSGSVAALSSAVLAFSLPGVLVSPIVGSLVDRYDRRLLLVVSALGAGVSTLAIMLFYSPDQVRIWRVLLCIGGISIFSSITTPTISALTARTVSKENLGRANGLWQVTTGLVFIVSPLVASLVLMRAGFSTVVLIDFCTYLVAIASLHWVGSSAGRPAGQAGRQRSRTTVTDLLAGWHYVRRRRGLRELLIFMTVVHVVLDLIQILIVPRVLNQGTTEDVATIMAVSSAGMIIGGVSMAITGGPRRRISGVLGAVIVLGIGLCLVGVAAAFVQIVAGMLLLSISVPIALSCTDAIWQSRVASARQGRVFAFKSMLAQTAQPLACLLAPASCRWVADYSRAYPKNFGIFIAPHNEPGVVLAIGGALVVLLAALASMSRSFRRLERERSEAADVTVRAFKASSVEATE